MRLRSLGCPRLAFLPRLGFADGHERSLPDLYEIVLAALHFVIEQRAANAVGATEIVYAPVHAWVKVGR